MRPFNLKEYLEHPDWKVATREGKPVRIVCTDLDDCNYPVAAAVKNFHVDKFTADGLFQVGHVNRYDLFFATEKHEGWVNLYHSSILNEIYSSKVYASEEDAKQYAGESIATIKVEWEE